MEMAQMNVTISGCEPALEHRIECADPLFVSDCRCYKACGMAHRSASIRTAREALCERGRLGATWSA
jgi:hypothetical protein